MPKVIAMDLARCTFCRACEVACEREHGGRSNMFVQLIDERCAVPINCRHCEDSPCTLVCPTQAVHRETEDAVTVTPLKCIGCALCTLACPFGAIWLDVLDRVARKCDLCLHRLEEGLEPACVATCSARALSFGEMDEFVARAKERGARAVISRATGPNGVVVTLPPGWEGAGDGQERGT
jgi:formate dehydrogenase iron-sulfur subunit